MIASHPTKPTAATEGSSGSDSQVVIHLGGTDSTFDGPTLLALQNTEGSVRILADGLECFLGTTAELEQLAIDCDGLAGESLLERAARLVIQP